MSTPDDANLRALLLLSKESLLARARESLLRGLPDDDLAELVAQMVSRDKPRGDLEEIARMMLDVLVRRDAQNDALLSLTTNDNSTAAASTEEIRVKYTSDVSPEIRTSHGRLSMRKRPASEQSVSTMEETASAKRAKHEDEDTAPSLRTWDQEQIAGKTVQVAGVVYWNPYKECYFKLALENDKDRIANLIADEFDAEYLSESDHIDTWKDMLKNPKHYMKKRWCVGRALNEKEEEFLGDDNMSTKKTTCTSCIQQQRICARLVNFAGSIKLAFFPLPPQLQCVDEIAEQGFWSQSSKYDEDDCSEDVSVTGQERD
ncbi:hypothetical protein COCMIDRAFT_90170 [Bipolaris oryzae ATCC 44560]|uniref:Uncharacterized protein n=1 Tax=Bipolaris oryzae ATCC 44560 TaxID=930090 RepID=W6ZIZ7_COCMI|nr:uncharacterized protein COCMIDRAFT_90170 [Bipolaris oryzae ATCC 44560]EUC47404.1 hypothetical protein COCMIDRAFT_90170 [Bipolaris oryzae ATCC 44560]